MTRFLTKSRFLLGHECPTKLFYTRKKEYADTKDCDDFLAGLAEGGMIVGELAKLYFPGGKEVTIASNEEASAETQELLQKDEVTIFEAAVTCGNLLCRIDVLVKSGNQLQLIEVKSKSIDGEAEDPIRKNNGEIRSSWEQYLLDVAFQRFVLSNAFPSCTINSYLMCVDKTKQCTVDGLQQLFRIQSEGDRKKCVFVGGKQSQICDEILARVQVDEYIDQLTQREFEGRTFEEYLNWLAEHYRLDQRIQPTIGKQCKECEFKCDDEARKNGLRNGFRECWSDTLGWKEEDFDKPTVFDLYGFTGTQRLIDERRVFIEDVSEDDINRKEDDKPGLHPSEMRLKQVEFFRNRRTDSYIDKDGLRQEVGNWTFPLHFIDFETAAPAVPLHRGLRPYQSIAFQFSHHSVDENGTVTHEGEYLNSTCGVFPNFDFLRKLKATLENDSGTVFRYANHENTILNHLVEQLDMFGQGEPDYDEIREFACSISQPTSSQPNPWQTGVRNMVDLRTMVARHYFHPRMKGSQSLKYVLPAMLNDSEFLKEKYSQPVYGFEITPNSSHNFDSQTWVQFDGDEVIDPYRLLPGVFDEIDNDHWKLLEEANEIRGGGSAMMAYLRLQHEDLPEQYRQQIQSGLLKYCELDTLAMVMIYEGWRETLR